MATHSVYNDFAIDAVGNVVVAWTESDGMRYTVWANRYDAARNAWGTARRIETSSSDAQYPSVGVDAAGNAIVAWLQTDGTRSAIGVNRFRADTGAWETPTLVATESQPYRMTHPRVATNDSGETMIVWEQSGGAFSVRTRSDAPVLIWSDVVPMVIGTIAGTGMTLTADTAGNVFAPLWMSGMHGKRWIAKTASWTSFERIGEVVPEDPRPLISRVDATGIPMSLWHRTAVSAAGDIVVAWNQFDGTRYHAWYNRYDMGSGQWGRSERVAPDATVESLNPSVGMDAGGNMVAVWQQFDGYRYNIWSKRFSKANRTWGEAVLIETQDGDARSPELAVDPAGNALVVWQQYDGWRRSVWASRYDAVAGKWSLPSKIDTATYVPTAGPDESWVPRVLANASGRAVAGWMRSYGNGLPFNTSIVLFK